MNKSLALLALLVLLPVTPVSAEPASPALRFSATVVQQSPAELNDGGEFAVTRSRLQNGGNLLASRRLIANWDLEIGMTHYDFDSSADERWDDIYQVGVNLSLIHPLNRHWSLLLIPGVSATGETDADVEKSLSYGMVAALNWRAMDGLRLGVGGALYQNLDELQGFPVLMIDWQLTPRWRLANPLRSGVTGPAGLELSWQAAKNWTLGTGSTWRSLRFRLDAKGTSPGGVGEEDAVPVWLRLTRQFARTQLTLYAGATLDGSLSSEDRHEHEVSHSDYDETPFLALYFSGGF